MKKLFATLLLLTAVCVATAPARAASASEDLENIEKVLEEFRTSIIKKERSRFLQLFFGGAIPFIGVTTDRSLAWENANKPSSNTPNSEKLFSTSNPRKFIDGIVNNAARIEQTFDKVRIETDGDVGQVWFDYTFIEGEYRAYSGKQSWHLVRGKEGWKISSVIWSIELNMTEAPPQPRKRF